MKQSSQPFSVPSHENEFIYIRMKNHLYIKGWAPTESQGNSEMAYCW